MFSPIFKKERTLTWRKRATTHSRKLKVLKWVTVFKWLTVNKWENKITYFKIGVKYFGTILSLQIQFQAFCWFYFLLIIPNLGASFRAPKSGNQSQKQLVLPPV